jgi:hypothetical protein
MISIPMGTNCALLFSFVFLHAYEPYFLQGFLKLSLNNSRFGDYLHLVNPNELEVMDATDTRKSTSFLNFHIEIENGWRLKTTLFDKRDDFTFPIVNFPVISSITSVWGLHWTTHTLFYGLYCTVFYLDRNQLLTRKLLKQGQGTWFNNIYTMI